MRRRSFVVLASVAVAMLLCTSAAFSAIASLNWENTVVMGTSGSRGLAIDQSNGDIYLMRPDGAVNKYDKNGNLLFTIGPAVTGADGSTVFTLTKSNPTGLAVDPLTRYLYLSFGSSIYCVDATTSSPVWVYTINVGSACQNLTISDDGQQLYVAGSKMAKQLLRNDQGTPDNLTDDQFAVSGVQWTEYRAVAPSDVRGVTIDRLNRVYITDLATTQRPVRRFLSNSNTLDIEFNPVTIKSWGCTTDADNRFWLSDIEQNNGLIRCYIDGIQVATVDPKSNGGSIGNPIMVACDRTNGRIVVEGTDAYSGTTKLCLQSWSVPSLAMISGQVTSSDGAPLPNTTVTCSDGSTVTTDSNGNYAMCVAAGTYTLTASRTCYNSLTLPEVTVADNDTKTVNFVLTGNVFSSAASLNWEIKILSTTSGTRSLAVDQSNGDIYVMRPDGVVLKYDKDGDLLFNIGPTITSSDLWTTISISANNPTGLAVDPLTRYLYMSIGSTIYCLDATTSTPVMIYSITMGAVCQNLAMSDDGQQLFVAGGGYGGATQLLRNNMQTPDDLTDDQFEPTSVNWNAYTTIAPLDTRGVTIDRLNRVYITDLATTQRPVRRFLSDSNTLDIEFRPVSTKAWGCTTDAYNDFWLPDIEQDAGLIRCYTDGIQNSAIYPLSEGGNIGNPIMIACDRASNRIIVGGTNAYHGSAGLYLQSWSVTPKSIVGKVTASLGGVALRNATVTCSNGYTVTTDSNGNYSMRLPAGAYRLTVSEPGFASVISDEITVTSGQVITADFVLTTNASAVEIDKLRNSTAYPDGTYVSLSSGDNVVTTLPSMFTDGSMYIEDANRVSGIRLSGVSASLALGDRITLIGKLSTLSSGERQLEDVTILSNTSGDTIHPLGMGNKAVTGKGISPIGLFAKAWGKVTFIDPDGKYMYIDDGSGVNDSSSAGCVGVRVILEGTNDPGMSGAAKVGDNVAVTGIVSVVLDGDKVIPVVKPSSAVDIDHSDYNHVVVHESDTNIAYDGGDWGNNCDWSFLLADGDTSSVNFTGDGVMCVAGSNYTRVRNHNTYAGVALADLTEFKYSTFVSQASANSTFSLHLDLDVDGDGVCDDDLVYEPYKNQTSPSGVVVGAWQVWDAFNGLWWSQNLSSDNGFTSSSPVSISTYLEKYPNAKLADSSYWEGVFSIDVNTWYCGQAGFMGKLGTVTVGTKVNGTTVYSFTSNPAAP